MAQPFVTGPCHLYVGIGSGFSPVYLGTCEKSPRIQIRPAWSEIYNDIAGQVIPYDKAFEGEDGFIIADMTRWNEAVFAALQNRPLGQNINRGTVPVGGIGTLMKTEQLAYPLWAFFPYSLKNAYATQPLGYHFVSTWLEGPDDLDQLGTIARRNRLIWYASPLISVSSLGVSQTLYDTLSASFSGLPSIN